jgi:hypothetical protein
MLILGEILFYLDEESKTQTENSAVALFFPDGHMSHIENQEELNGILLEFFKKI